MRIKELIEKLKQYDENLLVFYSLEDKCTNFEEVNYVNIGYSNNLNKYNPEIVYENNINLQKCIVIE